MNSIGIKKKKGREKINDNMNLEGKNDSRRIMISSKIHKAQHGHKNITLENDSQQLYYTIVDSNSNM